MVDLALRYGYHNTTAPVNQKLGLAYHQMKGLIEEFDKITSAASDDINNLQADNAALHAEIEKLKEARASEKKVFKNKLKQQLKEQERKHKVDLDDIRIELSKPITNLKNETESLLKKLRSYESKDANRIKATKRVHTNIDVSITANAFEVNNEAKAITPRFSAEQFSWELDNIELSPSEIDVLNTFEMDNESIATDQNIQSPSTKKLRLTKD